MDNHLPVENNKMIDTSPFFKLMLENARVACILILDLKGTILETNIGMYSSFGYKKEDIVGKNFSFLFTPEDRKLKKPETELITVAQKGSANDTNYIVHKDGSYIWVHGESIYVKDHNGAFFVKLIYDINEHKLLENFLVQSNEFNESIIEVINQPLIILSTELKIIKVNKAFYHTLHIKERDLYEESFFEVGEGVLDVPKIRDLINQVIATGESIESSEVYCNFPNVNKCFNVCVKQVFDPRQERRLLLGITDITLHRRSQEQLQKSVEHFKTVLETLPQIAWTALPDGNLNYYSQVWHDYTGLTFEETKDEGWKNAIHPDDYKPTDDLWKQSLKTGNIFVRENRFMRASDQMYRWHLVRGVPYKNDQGEMILWIGTATDTHDLKTALEDIAKTKQELLETNEELEIKNNQLNKINEDLDTFVYTASHDLKAPISNIEGLLSSLLENEECRKESGEIIEMINFSVQRFKTTIQDLTDVARVQADMEGGDSSIDFKEILIEVKSTLHEIIESSEAWILEDFTKATRINFSRKNLRSIIYNLVSNAIKYRSPDRKPKIEIKTELLDGYILLSVSDNGLGIREEDKEKVFSMFQRLHHHVEGSGVGMNIVRRIVGNSGGKIELESEVGKGSSFKVYLKNLINNINKNN